MMPKVLPIYIITILLLLQLSISYALAKTRHLQCANITTTPNCTCGIAANVIDVQCGNSMDMKYKQEERFEVACPTQLAANFDDFAETTQRPPRQALSYLQEVNIYPAKILKMQSCDFTNYPDAIEDILRKTKAIEWSLSYLILHNGVLELRHLSDNSTQSVLDKVTTISLRNSNLQVFPYELFQRMPMLDDLSLRENQLHYIMGPFSTSLRHLELAFNEISHITQNAFRGLTKLAVLQLFVNNITTLDPLVFQDLKSLKSLELMANHLTSVDGDLFANLTNLTWINLSRNELKSIPENIFWGNPLLNSSRLARNKLTSLPGGLFQRNPKLEIISLEFNQLETLPEDIFQGLTSLEDLNLSGNQLNEIAEGLFASLKKLTTLNLSSNKLNKIDYAAFNALSSLVKLDMSRNNLEVLEFVMFQSMGNLETLNLAQNMIAVPDDDFTFVNYMINLRTLDLSDNNMDVIPIDFVLRNRIEVINLERNKLTTFNFQVLENAISNLTLRLEDNNITTITGIKEAENHAKQEIQLSKLYKTVKLAGNPLRCDAYNYDLFRYFNLDVDTNFRYAYNIPGEGLNCAWPLDFEGEPFENMINPCRFTYNISTCPANCECTHVPFINSVTVNCTSKGFDSIPDLFVPQDDYSRDIRANCDVNDSANIRVRVILKDNNIQQVNPRDFMNITVSLLDVSYNNLSNISWLPSGLTALNMDHNHLQRINNTLLENLTEVTLDNNPWICDCETVPFWFYLADHDGILNKMEIRCFDSNQSIRKLTRDTLCPWYLRLWIALTIFLLLVLIPTALVAFYYRYRQEIKVWLFAHNMCMWFVREEDLDKDKIYDAFISFSQTDENFILDHLLPKLENGPDPYKICVHMRNWIPGEYIAKQVADSVVNSRRTMVVLSPAFLESVWGIMEFRTAHTKAISEGIARVIIILYDDLDPNDEKIDEELRAYLKTNTYIRWGDPWFWDKLKYALPHRKERSGGYINKRFDSVSVNLDKMDKINQNVSIAVNTNRSANPPMDPLVLKVHPLNINGRLISNHTPPAEKGVV